jgi:hypothetical protein
LAAGPITGSAAFSFVLAMQANTNVIERAFELAKSGRYVTLGQIKYRLHVEGYFADAITGTQLCERLKALMDTARKTRWHEGTGNGG